MANESAIVLIDAGECSFIDHNNKMQGKDAFNALFETIMQFSADKRKF